MEMNTFYALFAAAIIAAANSTKMKALFNKNLPFQTRVNMVNPENPDPNNWLRRAPSKLRTNTKKS